MKIKNIYHLSLLTIMLLGSTQALADDDYQRQQSAVDNAFDQFDIEMGNKKAPPPVPVAPAPVAKPVEVEKIIIIRERIIERVVPIIVAPAPVVAKPTPVATISEPVQPIAVAPAAATLQKKWPTQEHQGFIFNLTGCKKEYTTISCAFTVSRDDGDRDLLISANYRRYSKIFDDQGNQYDATMAYLSNASGGYAKRRMIQGVTAKGLLKFSNTRASIKQLSLLEIKADGGSWMSVQFRDIPL